MILALQKLLSENQFPSQTGFFPKRKEKLNWAEVGANFAERQQTDWTPAQ